MEWAPGRWFHVKHLPSGKSARIWDAFPFFQCSFLKACEEWGVLVSEEVKAGKAERRDFSPADLPKIVAYNREELATLVALLLKLKDGLYGAGIPLDQWYGAGAVATKLLAIHGARKVVVTTPPEVQLAALYAFFGGRIESGYEGRIKGPIYNRDLKSAYPDAMRFLPNLARGSWVHDTTYDLKKALEDVLTVCKVEWEFPEGWTYYPLPWRSKRGTIYFPRAGRGWYWDPEVVTAVLAARGMGGKVRLTEAWRFIPTDPNERAFPWVEELYERRREAGTKTGAGRSIKLGLNALFGKTVQREGVFGRTPTYRQYEYGGYITSYVRARLWASAEAELDRVISFATDGIYHFGGPRGPRAVAKRLEVENPAYRLPDPDLDMGEWEPSEFEAMDIVMAGVYRLRKADGSWELFGRGFGKDVPWEDVIAGWRAGRDKLVGKVSRFHGLGECIHLAHGRPWVDRDKWRSWTYESKEIRLRSPSLKRIGAYPPAEGYVRSLPFSPTFGAIVDSAPYDSRRSEESAGP